jgi:hypothetical protein
MTAIWTTLAILDFAALAAGLFYLVIRISQELEKEREG